jgi:hypothetical protein
MKNLNNLILSFLLLFFSMDIFASVGKVIFVKGEVWAVRGQNKHILEKNDDIHNDDEIITRKSSILKIKMNDATSIVIGPHSHFIFHDVKLNKKGEGRSTYDVTYGFIRAKFIRKKKKGEATFKTKNIAMGIRGTEFIVEVHNKDGMPHSKVALLKGNIDVDAHHPNKAKSRTFKLKKDHQFSSYEFEGKGLKGAHKRLSKKHLADLNKDKISFLHDVLYKGKPYPKYKLPSKFKKLIKVIKKKQLPNSFNRSKNMLRDKNLKRSEIQRKARKEGQIRKQKRLKKNIQQKKRQIHHKLPKQ